MKKLIPFLLAACTFLPHCMLLAAPAAPNKRPVTSKFSQSTLAPATVASISKPSLPSSTNGVGLVICSPLGANASPDLLNFGAGCTRWLQLFVGGQGEFGKTPPWGAIGEAGVELGHEDMRLIPENARKLAGILGIDRAATAQIEGNKDECKLKISVWQIPDGKLVGDVLALSGSEQQVIDSLPGAATNLAKLLGASAPHIPDTVGTSPNDMEFLGSVPWDPYAIVALATKARLVGLMDSSPLADMLILSVDDIMSGERKYKCTKALLTKTTANTLVAQRLARFTDEGEQLRSVIQSGLAKFPNSFLWNCADTLRIGQRSNRKLQRQAAWKTIQCNPLSPYGWLLFADSFKQAAQDIRQSRAAGDIAPEEWQALEINYDKQFDAVQHAVKLDSNNDTIQRALSGAATFAGDMAVANRAIERAMALAPKNPKNYEWALQIYQTKWQNEPARLLEVAQRAAEDPDLYSRLHTDIGNALWWSGHKDEYTTAFNTGYTKIQDLTLNDPKNDYAQFIMADVQVWQGGETEMSDAQQHLDEFIRLNDNAPEAIRLAGQLLYSYGKYDAAATYLERMVKAYPDSADGYEFLGDALWHREKYQEAADAYKKGLAVDPDRPLEWRSLGSSLFNTGNMKESVEAFHKSLELRPGEAGVWDDLGLSLRQTESWREAIDAFTKAIELNSDDWLSYVERGFVEFRAGQYEKAIKDAQVASQRSGDDEGRLTSVILISFSLRRLERTAESDKVLKLWSEKTKASAKTYPMLRYLRRKITADELLSLSKEGDQQKEAHAVIGVDLSISGDKVSAFPHLKWVEQNADAGFLERDLVLGELYGSAPQPVHE